VSEIVEDLSGLSSLPVQPDLVLPPRPRPPRDTAPAASSNHLSARTPPATPSIAISNAAARCARAAPSDVRAIRPKLGSRRRARSLTSEICDSVSTGGDGTFVAAADHHPSDTRALPAVAIDALAGAARRTAPAEATLVVGLGFHLDPGLAAALNHCGRREELPSTLIRSETSAYCDPHPQVTRLRPTARRRSWKRNTATSRNTGRDHPPRLWLGGHPDRAALEAVTRGRTRLAYLRWCGSHRRSTASPSGRSVMWTRARSPS